MHAIVCLIICQSKKQTNEYDQEMPQSQTIDTQRKETQEHFQNFQDYSWIQDFEADFLLRLTFFRK